MYSIIQGLESTSSRNEKIAILKKNVGNKTLAKFFSLALDPMITFGIKKIPTYDQTYKNTFTIDWAMDELQKLINRELTGNAGIDHLTNILSSLKSEDANLIERIIEKDPKCGVASATVNAVWENLIFEFPVMKASPHDEKTIQNISFPAYSQVKLDGARCCIVIVDGTVTLYSANGRDFVHHNQFDYLGKITKSNIVLDGELLVIDEFGKFLDRKKGNGIVNRSVRGTISVDQAKSLHFVVFDMIDYDDWRIGLSKVPYSKRFERLMKIQNKFRNNISLVGTEVVSSERQAMNHFKKLYALGEEGTILKDANSIWENKRSKYQLKYKGILTCDLVVVDVEEGTGRNKGKLGALVCESNDGLLQVNVGTGFSDADRAEKFDFWRGKIVEVQYNERILAKEKDSKYSLFLPRFVQVRIDKNNADSLENISVKGE